MTPTLRARRRRWEKPQPFPTVRTPHPPRERLPRHGHSVTRHSSGSYINDQIRRTPFGGRTLRPPNGQYLMSDELSGDLAGLGHRRHVRTHPLLGELARLLSVCTRVEHTDRGDRTVLLVGL